MVNGFLEDIVFEQVVHYAPLCAIDFVLRDPTGAVLVGARRNQPAKGFYFVPGGRIRKDERLAQAFRRLLLSETSIEASIEEAAPLGVFEHFYETNTFEREGFGTHYICLPYEITLDHRPVIRGDCQHSELRWASSSDLAALRVHPYAMAYLERLGQPPVDKKQQVRVLHRKLKSELERGSIAESIDGVR